MTDQEKAKQLIETVSPWEGEIVGPVRQSVLDLLAPIAAGTHQIVPKEPTEKMIDAALKAAEET